MTDCGAQFSTACPEETAACYAGRAELPSGGRLPGCSIARRVRIDIGGVRGRCWRGWGALAHFAGDLLELPEVIVHAGPILAEHRRAR